MAKRPEDRYSNLASAVVTESAAGSLTFAELVTGISLGQGIGMLIDKIEYRVTEGALEDVIGAGDTIQMGWATSSSVLTLDFNDRRVIDYVMISNTIVGAVVSQWFWVQPFTKIYNPPIVIAAPRLFLGILGVSLAAPVSVQSRFYFRYLELTDKEYLEIAETFILVG